MKSLGNRGFAAMALLSIILPMGLLVSFRFTGILKEPPTTQTIPVEATIWSISRPIGVDIITIDKWMKNSYANSAVSIELSVQFVGYYENQLDFPSGGDDDVAYLRIIATANVSDGFIYSMAVRFPEVDGNAVLYIDMNKDFRNLVNLQEGSIGCSSRYKGGAYFMAYSLNRSKNASLSILSYWVFLDQDSVNHAMTATLETTYFNGTTYLRVGLPIQLSVLLDAGDSFESAKIIRIYTQSNESLGAGNDFEDYYCVLVDVVEPRKFEVCMTPSSNVDFDLYIYNQNRELVGNSTSRGQGVIERLIVTFDSGKWYIRVSDPIKLENGTYTLTINYPR